MIIDHQRRFIFISVPKTASISVQFSLGFGHDIPEPHLYHQGIESVLASNPGCNNYFKFAFVRNPWDRILSLYHDFTMKRVKQYSAKVQHETPLFGEFRDFEDFCVRIHTSPWMSDIFLKSQYELLSVAGVLAMNYVGKFEKLLGDFAKICDLIGMEGTQLQQHNVGVYDKRPYRDHYSQRARGAIAALYKCDAEAFGYEF